MDFSEMYLILSKGAATWTNFNQGNLRSAFITVVGTGIRPEHNGIYVHNCKWSRQRGCYRYATSYK